MVARLAPVLAVALAACGVQPTLSSLQENVFTPRCATAGCHDDGSRAGQLSLAPGRSHVAIVGVAAKNVGVVDDGTLLVKPGDPDASFLVTKVRPKVPVAAGVRMPPSGSGEPLSDEEIAAIEEWVRAGAKDD
jgi:hypothetical protein